MADELLILVHMSAASIAKRRLQHGADRTGHHRAPHVSAQQAARLRLALLAADSGGLALSPTATFEPLLAVGTDVSLGVRASKLFASHTTYRLPREDGSTDTVHRFHMGSGAEMLNNGLKRFALHREGKARESRAMPAQLKDGTSMTKMPPPGRRADAGVSISNQGGYQSYPDLFDHADQLKHAPSAHASAGWSGAREFEDADLQGRRWCHELHQIASVAVEDCEWEGQLKDHGEGKLKDHGNGIPRAAHAWLNINRADDVNLMHLHNAERYSGTYYVSASPSSAQVDDGRMLLRAGPKRRIDGASPPASHSYMTIPPVPGTFWLFPGSVPHRVLGMLGAADTVASGTRGMWAPRISIAMNFTDARTTDVAEAGRSNMTAKVGPT